MQLIRNTTPYSRLIALQLKPESCQLPDLPIDLKRNLISYELLVNLPPMPVINRVVD